MSQEVIRFKELDYGAEDEDLLKYWHIIIPPQDYTACGQATDEYEIERKQGLVTCPKCIKIIKEYQNIRYKKSKEEKDGIN